MFAYGLGKFKSLFELKSHASRSSLSRLPSGTKKPEVQKPMTYSKGALFRKNTWRELNKPLGNPNPLSVSTHGCAHGGAHGAASGNGTSSHGLSAHGQKRKLPLHEKKKKLMD